MDWLSYTGLALLSGSGIAYLYFNRRPDTQPALEEDKHVSMSAAKIHGDKFLILSPAELIEELDLQPSITNIRSNLGLSNENWHLDGLPLIHNFINFVQRLPASESHHHAGDGGLVKHTLDVAALSLLASSSRSWPPNAKTEDIARLTAVWRYGILTAALLHDIGKTLTSFEVELYEQPDSKAFSLWLPDTGDMNESGKNFYRVTFPDNKTPYEVHASLGWTFFQSIVPSNARKWMNESDPNLIKTLRSYLSGSQKDGPLADIIKQADMASTARDLRHGSRQRFSTAKRTPLIETIMTALRNMLAERGAHFSIATTAGGDIFRKDDMVFMMAKNVPDYIREYLKKNKHPAAPSFPTDNQRIFDTLLEYGAVIANPYDEHKAVTHVLVSFERMDGMLKKHIFTMLRFKLETLYPDGHYPHEFSGTLEITSEIGQNQIEPSSDNGGLEKNVQTENHSVENEHTEYSEKAMDFMAVNTVDTVLPKAEAVSMPEKDVVAIDVPPAPKKKAKQKGMSGIDALLSVHNLYLLDDSETEAERPDEAITQDGSSMASPQVTSKKMEEKTEIQPPQKKSNPVAAPVKNKLMSVLDDLFADFETSESKLVSAQPDNLAKPVYLAQEDTAAAEFEEIKTERLSLPVQSPRPVMPYQQENILDQEPKQKQAASEFFAGQKQALKDEGKRFWNWLANGLSEGTITVNQSSSPIHFVEQGMLLVTPVIFREYAGGLFDKNNPSCPGLLAQKGFTSLGLHERTRRSAIYSALAVKAQQKLLFHCYLIPESKVHLIIKADRRPPNNIDIVLADSQNLLQPGVNGEQK